MDRSFRHDERGISVVVGAMLIFAIVITIFASVRATVIPNLEADAEAAHMRSLSQQLIGLRTDVQRQIELDSANPLSHSLQMGRQKVGVFDSGQDADRIGLIFPNERFSISSPNVLVEDPSSGASEGWQAIAGAGTQPSIKSIESLRIKINEVSKAKHGGSVTLSIEDKDNKFKGCFRIRVDDLSSSDYYLFFETYDNRHPTGDPLLFASVCPDAPSSPTAHQPALVNRETRAYHQSHAFAPYFVDALDPSFRFDRIIEAAAAPLKLTLTVVSPLSSPLTASYAMKWTAYSASGPGVPMGGGGTATTGYARHFDGGYLEYEARNRHFIPQIYRLEHGVLILKQPQGEVMRVAPDIRAELIGGTLGIVASLPSLNGDARTLVSQGTTVVRSSVISTTDVSILAPELTITIQTQHPALWRNYFDELLRNSGLSTLPVPQYTLMNDATSVTITILGATPANPLLPTVYDIRLLLQQADVDIKLNP